MDVTGGAEKSKSEELRLEGNKHYAKASSNFSPAVRKERLSKALNLYHCALKESTKQPEKCSAAKNIAIASWNMAQILHERHESIQLRHMHYRNAILNFNTAHNFGSCKSGLWLDSLTQSLYGCIQDAINDITIGDELIFSKKVLRIEDFIKNVTIDFIKAEFYLELANVIFREGVSALQKGDNKAFLNHMRETYTPVEEARRWGKDQEHIQAEVRVLEQDIFIHTCVAESAQARNIGDDLLDQILKNEEDLNVDMVWEVCDWYKQASILTRENDVEMEAIALSRLGHVYDRVLKMKAKASENFKRAIQLALSLHPRTFNSEKWFQECENTLRRYQREIVEQEMDKWQKERAQYLDELKTELTELKEYESKPSETLLEFIYEKFPPKNPNHKLLKLPSKGDEDFNSKLKKLLRNAVIHYHPDRQDVEKHGKKWKVLAEEITKMLTNSWRKSIISILTEMSSSKTPPPKRPRDVSPDNIDKYERFKCPLPAADEEPNGDEESDKEEKENDEEDKEDENEDEEADDDEESDSDDGNEDDIEEEWICDEEDEQEDD